jgi:hypothetical protein
MRRPTLFGLVIVVLLLGAYTVYWFIAAGRIEDGIAAWAGSLRRQNLDLTWSAIRTGGFPFAFDVRLSDAKLRNTVASPGGELNAPALAASARPWNFNDWRLSAPNGLNAHVGPPERPLVKVAAQAATGAVSVGGEGNAAVWLTLNQATAELPEHLSAETAHLWAIVPRKPPQEHTDPALGIAADLHGLSIAVMPSPFRGAADDLTFGATVLGAFPAAPLRQAAAAWRDSGGTVELDHFTLRWGGLAVHGSGTLALGPDMQPIGAFSGGVSGFDELINALAAAGQLRMGDITIARIGLAALARPGPNGRPEISTSFTIQNGEMHLGPLKLGPVPRINW